MTNQNNFHNPKLAKQGGINLMDKYITSLPDNGGFSKRPHKPVIQDKKILYKRLGTSILDDQTLELIGEMLKFDKSCIPSTMLRKILLKEAIAMIGNKTGLKYEPLKRMIEVIINKNREVFLDRAAA